MSYFNTDLFPHTPTNRPMTLRCPSPVQTFAIFHTSAHRCLLHVFLSWLTLSWLLSQETYHTPPSMSFFISSDCSFGLSILLVSSSSLGFYLLNCDYGNIKMSILCRGWQFIFTNTNAENYYLSWVISICFTWFVSFYLMPEQTYLLYKEMLYIHQSI